LLSQLGFHLYSERYMFFILPAVCLLVGAGIAGLSRRWIAVAAAVVVLAAAVRSLALSRPLPEAVQQAIVLTELERRVEPTQTLLAADTHSLLFLRHHWPEHERTRLLWVGRGVPYYDAALVIPPEWIVGPVAVDSLRNAGVPWFAMHTHNSGTDVGVTTVLLDSVAGPPVASLGLVRVWAGGVVPAMSPR
jgi:hypothetical protein